MWQRAEKRSSPPNHLCSRQKGPNKAARTDPCPAQRRAPLPCRGKAFSGPSPPSSSGPGEQLLQGATRKAPTRRDTDSAEGPPVRYLVLDPERPAASRPAASRTPSRRRHSGAPPAALPGGAATRGHGPPAGSAAAPLRRAPRHSHLPAPGQRRTPAPRAMGPPGPHCPCPRSRRGAKRAPCARTQTFGGAPRAPESLAPRDAAPKRPRRDPAAPAPRAGPGQCSLPPPGGAGLPPPGGARERSSPPLPAEPSRCRRGWRDTAPATGIPIPARPPPAPVRGRTRLLLRLSPAAAAAAPPPPRASWSHGPGRGSSEKQARGSEGSRARRGSRGRRAARGAGGLQRGRGELLRSPSSLLPAREVIREKCTESASLPSAPRCQRHHRDERTRWPAQQP